MKYMDIGCNVNCWECHRNCDIRELMIYSITLADIPGIIYTFSYKDNVYELKSKDIINFFYFTIIDFLKTNAGMLIAQGKDFHDVQSDLKELAVSFYVARLKIIETSKK